MFQPASAGTASGSPTLLAAVSPTTLRFPGRHTLIYELAIRTGQSAAKLRVELVRPPYDPSSATRGSALLALWGSPIRLIGHVTLDGQGTVARVRVPEIPGLLALRWGCTRGYGVSAPPTYRIDVPPNSQATMRVPARADVVPYADSDYRLRFRVRMAEGGRRRQVVAPPVRLEGQTRTRIVLGRKARRRFTPMPVLARGSGVTLVGTSSPAFHGQVVVRAVRITPGGVVAGRRFTVARVRAKAEGVFRFRFAPQRAGTYRLFARKRWGEDVPSESCPLRVVRPRR